MSELRIYEPDECGADGYPLAWHRGEPAIKDLVRELAGHRCVRCGHPFRVGETPGHWSPCDEECTHGGPARYTDGEQISPVVEGADALEIARAGLFVPTPDEGGERGPERWVEAEWRVLTVHHLTGDKADCRWWNLAALCQRCHLTIQGKVKMERGYLLEHSEWMKPYVAGYYATAAGEDLTREETEARLPELLALAAVA